MLNMVKALWVYLVTGEFGIPSVYKPFAVTRQLRKLFSQYGLLNRQIRMLKNNVQAILMENGIVLPSKGVRHLLSRQALTIAWMFSTGVIRGTPHPGDTTNPVLKLPERIHSRVAR